MKNPYKILLLITVICISGIFNCLSAKETETEGTSFWFAIPFANHYTGEASRGTLTGNYFELWVTAKITTNVRLYDSHQNLIKTYQVVGGKYLGFPIPADKMHNQSETIETDKAMYVESDEPISLIVYAAYYNTGEAYRVIPAQWLGTDYYTLNLYNDYLLFLGEGSTPRTTPNQFLIVATEDNTNVDIYPNTETMKHVKAGIKKSITLNKGQSYLVLSDTNCLYAQYDETDLTGSHIVADKPIAVFSGHTKGTYPKLAPKYYGIRCDWGRNMLFDSMWPTNLLGKYYVTVKNHYLDREKDYQGLIAEERGDMIRFVATQDNTTIYEARKDSSGWVKLATIKKAGQWFALRSEEDPQYFKATSPVLVGQYGKSCQYWPGGSIYYGKEGSNNSKEDELQNPHETGQGQLYAITPIEQWANYSGFVSPIGVNNWFNLIFRTGEESHISMNGENIVSLYGSAIQKIPGSPFSYIAHTTSAGGNYVISDKSDVLFSVYAYGDLDAYKNGFAYGYPTTVNYFQPCSDSIYITSITTDSAIYGKVTAVDLKKDTSCSKIQSFKYEVSTRHNAKFTSSVKTGAKTGDFTITFPDATSQGYIKVVGITASGSSVTKEFTYSPDKLSANPTNIDFGKMVVGATKDTTVSVTNGTAHSIHIQRLYLKNSNPIYSITTSAITDFSISAGETKSFSIHAAKHQNDASLFDTLCAALDNENKILTALSVELTDAEITMNDLVWTNVSLNGDYKKTKQVTIENSGSTPCQITGYTIMNPDDDHFTVTGDIIYATTDNPLIISGDGGKSTFDVTYNPLNEVGVLHLNKLTVKSSNTTGKKLESSWSGIASNASSVEEKPITNEYRTSQITPNPAKNYAKISFNVPSASQVKIELYSESGAKVKTYLDEFQNAGQYENDLNTDDLSSGTYSLKISIGYYSETLKFVIIK